MVLQFQLGLLYLRRGQALDSPKMLRSVLASRLQGAALSNTESKYSSSLDEAD